jgi:hypothetical protein
MRTLAALMLILALAVTVSACGGAGRKLTQDEIESCLKDSGHFFGVKNNSQYRGTRGGLQATYSVSNPVDVDILIGDNSGEASNLSDNMKGSPAWVDVTRVKNVVYAIPVADKDSPNRSAAGDATKSCL